VISGEWSAEHYLKVASNLFSEFSVPGVEEEEVEEVVDIIVDILELANLTNNNSLRTKFKVSYVLSAQTG
jgi:hypothetical protein